MPMTCSKLLCIASVRSLLPLVLVSVAACMSTNNAVAHVDVSWTLDDSAPTVTMTTCPSGFDTAALYSQEVDGNNNPLGQPTINLLECAAGSGSSNALPPGAYNEWVVIENHQATMTAASSPTTLQLNNQPLILGNMSVPITEIIVLDGGFFRYEWGLIGATSGSAVMCANANATTLQLTATNVQNTTSVFTESTPCSSDTVAHVALTNPIPTGLYTIGLVAMNAAGSALGPVKSINNAMIDAASAVTPVTDLGSVMIEINGM